MKNGLKIQLILLVSLLLCLVASDSERKEEKTLQALSIDGFEQLLDSGVRVIDTRYDPETGIINGSLWVSDRANLTMLLSFVGQLDKESIVIVEEGKIDQITPRLREAGLSNILGYNGFNMKEWNKNLVKIDAKRFEQLSKEIGQAYIDVRSKPQLLATGIFQGALHAPISEFKSKLNQVAEFMRNHPDEQIVVHCRFSQRARLAASIMLSYGLGPVTVLETSMDEIKKKGINLVSYQQEL